MKNEYIDVIHDYLEPKFIGNILILFKPVNFYRLFIKRFNKIRSIQISTLKTTQINKKIDINHKHINKYEVDIYKISSSKKKQKLS